MTARLPAARLGTDYSEDYPVHISRSLDLGLTWNSAELDSDSYVAMGVTAAEFWSARRMDDPADG